jgi:outer membrane protein assembly factor BamB
VETRWTTRCCSALALTLASATVIAGQGAPFSPIQIPPKASSASPAPMSPFPAEVRWTLALKNALVTAPAYQGSAGYFPIQGDRIAAYDLNAGTLLWIASARPTLAPAVGGELLFFEEAGGLVALHVADGSLAWRVPLTERLAVPLVWDSGRLVAATHGAVLAFDADDGTLQWRRDLGAKPHRAPSLAGDAVYLSAADGRVIALRADNGEIRWERRLREVANDILVADEQLFVGSNDNYLYCLNVRDGRIEWRSPQTGADVVSRPAVDERRVYFVSFDNVLRALNRSHGVQQWKKGLTFRPTRSPLIALDTILVAGIDGPILAFFRKDGASGGQMPTGADQIAAEPHVFESPFTLGPMIVVVTRNLKAGATVTAVSLAIDPPFTTGLMAPLPGATPVDVPIVRIPGDQSALPPIPQ